MGAGVAALDAPLSGSAGRGRLRMRKVLVLAPYFPPTDVVDVHRVRMTVGHYRAFGWEPVVLSVRGDQGLPVDPALSQTLPADLRIETVAVPQRAWQKWLGVNTLGLRAGGPLGRA